MTRLFNLKRLFYSDKRLLKDLGDHNVVTDPKKLYKALRSISFHSDNFQRSSINDNMEVIKTLLVNYWKLRYLVDHDIKSAYEFMDSAGHLVGVEDSDIDWESLEGIPKDYIARAKNRNASFPSFIGCFKNNVAEVQWQLNPDGRYWMDDDGYGTTSDEEFNIYGFIDRKGKVVVPYQRIKDFRQLSDMRRLAENYV